MDEVKIVPAIAAYLESLRIERREYVDLWTFLRKREWGEGKVRGSAAPPRLSRMLTDR